MGTEGGGQLPCGRGVVAADELAGVVAQYDEMRAVTTFSPSSPPPRTGSPTRRATDRTAAVATPLLAACF